MMWFGPTSAFGSGGQQALLVIPSKLRSGTVNWSANRPSPPASPGGGGVGGSSSSASSSSMSGTKSFSPSGGGNGSARRSPVNTPGTTRSPTTGGREGSVAPRAVTDTDNTTIAAPTTNICRRNEVHVRRIVPPPARPDPTPRAAAGQ